MTEHDTAGWFGAVDPGDLSGAREAIEGGTADATRQAVRDRERADDQQLVHAVRSMDDLVRTA